VASCQEAGLSLLLHLRFQVRDSFDPALVLEKGHKAEVNGAKWTKQLRNVKHRSMRILLLIPPMTQLNTPYPSTAYLTGFLKMHGHDVRQDDPALKLVLRLFSQAGVRAVADEVRAKARSGREARAIAWFLERFDEYAHTVEPLVRFLQGKDPGLAMRIASRTLLPEGPRFAALDTETDASHASVSEDPLIYAFGSLGVQDRAKYLASLYLDDLADVIRAFVDPRFELTRYGEKLAASAPSFDPLQSALEGKPTLVDRLLDELVEEILRKHDPEVVGLSVPFPGNVYGALRIARTVKRVSPRARVILGGGYVNTELRELSEPRLFDYVDAVTLDDGERPFLNLLDQFAGKPTELLRTFVRERGEVAFKTTKKFHDIPQKDVGTPSYEGLPLDSYLSIFEMLNPMHRIWSDGRWNKLTLAHGCYWKKCSFCDVTLDYIGRYDPSAAAALVDRMESLIRETGQTGFHFVDEAAPPALLKGLAQEILRRGLVVSWWGNIRFEKSFTPELCELLARSGCVAVSGGLEVASDRLLKLMNKGVTVEQVARVSRAFTEAGVLVHAYLMYGFPTQTTQETIDALERVRQLFEEGCIHSAYWHRFSTTAHSPIGRDPEKYGIRLLPQPEKVFARNDLPFEDPTGTDHDALGVGLRKALYNYMHGVGLDVDVRFWFEGMKVPKAKVPRSLVRNALSSEKKREAQER
jgi:radical SAM superfamily enzyme YgiQ (UPF0313 family)